MSDVATVGAYSVFIGSYIVFALGKFPGNIEHAALVKPGLVAALVLAGFLAGFPPPLVAAVGAAIMLITRTRDPHLVYEEVDWGLLFFFHRPLSDRRRSRERWRDRALDEFGRAFESALDRSPGPRGLPMFPLEPEPKPFTAVVASNSLH
jgi:hypothetical protein